MRVLPLFNGSHELRRFQQRVGRAGIEPRIAAAHAFHAQLSALEIDAVQISDFQLTARGRPQPRRDLRPLTIVEVEPGYGPMGLRNRWFFLDGSSASRRVKRYDAVTLGIRHMISKNAGANPPRRRGPQKTG